MKPWMPVALLVVMSSGGARETHSDRATHHDCESGHHQQRFARFCARKHGFDRGRARARER